MSVLKTYGADVESFKPSTTYKINGKHIEGVIDEIQAVEQAAQLILSIERFENIIYSYDYGVELRDLIGKPREYVKGDIERRIRETLQQDERIESITNFNLTFDGECALVTFIVTCIFGDFEMERSFANG